MQININVFCSEAFTSSTYPGLLPALVVLKYHDGIVNHALCEVLVVRAKAKEKLVSHAASSAKKFWHYATSAITYSYPAR